jgi:TP901 family phage tail tape measure protein
MADREEVIIDLTLNKQRLDNAFNKLEKSVTSLELSARQSLESIQKYPSVYSKVTEQADKLKNIHEQIQKVSADTTLTDKRRKEITTQLSIEYTKIKNELGSINSIANQAKRIDKERVISASALVEKYKEAVRQAEYMKGSFSELGGKQNLNTLDNYIKQLKGLQSQSQSMVGLDITDPKNISKLNDLNNKLGETKSRIGDVKSALEVDAGGLNVGNIVKRAVAYTALFQAISLVTQGLGAMVRHTLEAEQAGITLAVLLDTTREKGVALESQLISLSSEYGQQLTAINNVAKELARAGVAYRDVAEATEVVNKLALLTGDTIESSTGAIVSFMQVFGKDQMGKVVMTVDELGAKLANLANVSKLNTEDINIIGNYALSSAKSVGLTIDAFTALSASMSNTGKKASTIGTNIRRFSEILNEDNNKVVAFFDRIGVNQKELARNISKGGEESNKALKGFLQDINRYSTQAFTQALEGTDTLVRDTLQSLFIASDSIQKELDKSLQVDNTALDKAKEITESMAITWAKLGNNILERVTPAVEGLGMLITDVIANPLNSLFERSKGGITTVRFFTNIKDEVNSVGIALGSIKNQLNDLYTGQGESFDKEYTKVTDNIKNKVKEISILQKDMLKDNKDAFGTIEYVELEAYRKELENILSIIKSPEHTKIMERAFTLKEAQKESEKYLKQIEALTKLIENGGDISERALKSAQDEISKLGIKFSETQGKIESATDTGVEGFDRIDGIVRKLSGETLSQLDSNLSIIKSSLRSVSREGLKTIENLLKTQNFDIDTQISNSVIELRNSLTGKIDDNFLNQILDDSKPLGDRFVVLQTKLQELRKTNSEENKDELATLSKAEAFFTTAITAKAKLTTQEKEINNLKLDNAKIEAEIAQTEKFLVSGKYSRISELKNRVELAKQSLTLASQNIVTLEDEKRYNEAKLKVLQAEKNLKIAVQSQNEKNIRSNASAFEKEKKTLQDIADAREKLAITIQKQYSGEEGKRTDSQKLDALYEQLFVLEQQKDTLALSNKTEQSKLDVINNEIEIQKVRNSITKQEEQMNQKNLDLYNSYSSKVEEDIIALQIKLGLKREESELEKRIREIKSSNLDETQKNNLIAQLQPLKDIESKHVGINKAIIEYSNTIPNINEAWENITKGGLSSANSAMVEFFDITSEGFMDMEKLASSVLSSILKQLIQNLIVAQIMRGLMQVFGGGGGSSSTDIIGTNTGANANFTNIGISKNKNGGELPIMNYANGGLLTGGSGIRDDLYLGSASGSHVFAMGGEYITKKSSVNGNTRDTLNYINETGTVPNNGNNVVVNSPIKINVENQSGTPIEAEMIEQITKSQGNDEERVINIILKRMSTDASFRNMVRGGR